MARHTLLPFGHSRTLARVAVYAMMVGAYAALAVLKEHSIYASVDDQPAEIQAALTLVLETVAEHVEEPFGLDDDDLDLDSLCETIQATVGETSRAG